MKIVGRRKDRPSTLADAGPLQRLASQLRRAPGLAPRGVFRFTSFEEAERWLIEKMTSTCGSRSSKTSSASAVR